MAGFDDLITSALPYLATETIQATAGTTWRWDYAFFDGLGDVVDLSTGYTATAVIRSDDGATSLTPATSYPSAGILRCLVTPANSVLPVGIYNHEVTVTRDSDSARIIVVGATHSKFVVLKKVAA